MNGGTACALGAAVTLLGACAQPEKPMSHAAWQAEAVRSWPGETRARLIAGAEAVLNHAAPRRLSFEYTQNGFRALRRSTLYGGLVTAELSDRWRFAASANDAGAAATVRMVQHGTASAGTRSQSYREPNLAIGGFRLFYARLDYVLGRRADWVSCAAAAAALGLDPAAPGTGALCGLGTEDGPPPPRLVAPAPVRPGTRGTGAARSPVPPDLPDGVD
jgi:hypothetical protein